MAQKKKTESLEELSYEEGYTRLQEVLSRLENGDTPLEDSLKLYAQGTQLAAHCAAKLEEAELTVRRWQGQEETTDFEEWRE
ncbi:MAG: exodeoxyribonuclease VII small subunit [Caldilineaceae bacterium]|nr:exodeoxyribonuclease VII small subunit [Caldilineaceae bacterium]